MGALLTVLFYQSFADIRVFFRLGCCKINLNFPVLQTSARAQPNAQGLIGNNKWALAQKCLIISYIKIWVHLFEETKNHTIMLIKEIRQHVFNQIIRKYKFEVLG